jgi:hypothetical protein
MGTLDHASLIRSNLSALVAGITFIFYCHWSDYFSTDFVTETMSISFGKMDMVPLIKKKLPVE